MFIGGNSAMQETPKQYSVAPTSYFKVGRIFRYFWVPPSAAGRTTEPPPTAVGIHSPRIYKVRNGSSGNLDDSTTDLRKFAESDLGASTTSMTSESSIFSSDPRFSPLSQRTSQATKETTGKSSVIYVEIRQRQDALQTIFQNCINSEFDQTRYAISCVFNCAELLSPGELYACTTINSLGRDWRSAVQDKRWLTETQWMDRCRSIFAETQDGKIDFIQPVAMRILLQRVRIPGIDTSHKTLGLICRNLVEMRNEPGGVDARHPDLVRALQVLSPYVERFAAHHLRLASLTSMVVIGQDDKCTKIKDDFESVSRRTEQLSLASSRSDWVVVKQI